MSWAQSGDGSWTHSGTDREVLVFDGSFPTTGVARAQIQSIDHDILFCLHMTQDGRTCWEAGVVGGALLIRRVLMGIAEVAVESQTHGISAGVPAVIECRREEDRIVVTIQATGEPVTEASWTNTSEPTLREYAGWGISSDADGARVLVVELCERDPVIAEESDVLVVACGGDTYGNYGAGFVKIGTNCWASTSDVNFAMRLGLVYGVDGQNAKISDVVNRRTDDWGPAGGGNWILATNGKLPGAPEVTAGEYAPGKTTATSIAAFEDCIALGDGRNVYFSALSDDLTDGPRMWRLDDPIAGGAFVTDPVPDQINGLWVTPFNTLLIGGVRTLHQWQGHPIRSDTRLRMLSGSVGASGARAAALGFGVAMVLHTPEGLQLVGPEGAPIPLSAPVVQTGMQFDPGTQGNYWVTVVRHPGMSGLFVFLTPRSNTSGTHWYYAEGIGGYQPGEAAFFPMAMALASMQPTCAAWWRGKLVVGCKDGVVRFLDPEARSDSGAGIQTRMMLEQINVDGVGGDSLLRLVDIELSDGSGPVKATVYAAPTSESLYNAAGRVRRAERTLYPRKGRMLGLWRGCVMGIELAGVGVQPWSLEAVEAEVDVSARLRRGGAVALPVAGVACTIGGEESGGGGGGGVTCKPPSWDVSSIPPGASASDAGAPCDPAFGCARYNLAPEFAAWCMSIGITPPGYNCCSHAKSGWGLTLERKVCIPGGDPASDMSFLETSTSFGNMFDEFPVFPTHTVVDYVGTELEDISIDGLYEPVYATEGWGGTWIEVFGPVLAANPAGWNLLERTVRTDCDNLEIKVARRNDVTGVSESMVLRLGYLLVDGVSMRHGPLGVCGA